MVGGQYIWRRLSVLMLGAGMLCARVTAATSASSLNACQNAVKLESRKFVQGYLNAVGSCLQKVSTAMVQKNAPDATGAAAPCITQFRKLRDTRGLGKSLAEKLKAGIERRCTPGGVNSFSLQDVLGVAPGVGRPLDVVNLNGWCAHFGGDGTIDTVDEWISCVTAALECDVREALTVQYPRGLEWLAAVRPAMQAFPSPAADPMRSDDAVAELDAMAGAVEGGNVDLKPNLQCGSSCGDGVRNGGEPCDGADLGGASCTSLGFLGGTLACNAGCGFNTSGCVTNLCGNGAKDGIESCDGDDLGGASCISLGFVGGSLACGAGCRFDTTGCVPTLCGNGVKDGSESCDGSDLGGQTCASLGYALNGTLTCTAGCGFDPSGCVGQTFSETGQTACYDSFGAATPCAGTGQDGDVRAGAPLAFIDNGDGTITDLNTHLMWEKKSDDASIHDRDNVYSWTSAFGVFIHGLNVANFAGHNDWRLPNKRELDSILSAQAVNPSVSAAFNSGCSAGCAPTACSCTPSSNYWSSTSYAASPDGAWVVSFGIGFVFPDNKSNNYCARAVRGGL